jgi:hypothetical protein
LNYELQVHRDKGKHDVEKTYLAGTGHLCGGVVQSTGSGSKDAGGDAWPGWM